MLQARRRACIARGGGECSVDRSSDELREETRRQRQVADEQRDQARRQRDKVRKMRERAEEVFEKDEERRG